MGEMVVVDTVKQLCVKSFHIRDSFGTEWTAEQGKEYTTTVPDESETVTVFSRYWVPVPKGHFVIAE